MEVADAARLWPCSEWLWRTLAAAAPIGSLAWEPPYAVGAALKRTKEKKKKKDMWDIAIAIIRQVLIALKAYIHNV